MYLCICNSHTHIDNCSTDFCLNACFIMIAYSNAAAIVIYWNCIIINYKKIKRFQRCLTFRNKSLMQ